VRDDEFRRLLGPLNGRVRMMVGRGTIGAVDDSRLAQELQVQGLADELHDGVEHFQQYGFTSHPLPGAEVATVAVGGTRSHQIVVAVTDRRSRLRDLTAGEVALYDDQGQMVILRRDGIEIVTEQKLTIRASEVLVEADSIDLGGEGGPAVARIGDTVAGGVITSGSAKVRAA
jgi:phage baseplate assembly protein V